MNGTKVEKKKRIVTGPKGRGCGVKNGEIQNGLYQQKTGNFLAECQKHSHKRELGLVIKFQSKK